MNIEHTASVVSLVSFAVKEKEEFYTAQFKAYKCIVFSTKLY